MVMDPGIELSGVLDDFRFGDHLSNQGAVNSYKLQGSDPYFNQNNHVNLPPPYVGNLNVSSAAPLPTTTATTNLLPHPTSLSPGDDDTLDLSEINSDIALQFISEMLLEENMEDKVYMHQGDPALLAAEKPFFEILSENYTSFSVQPPCLYSNNCLESPDDSDGACHSNSNNGSSIAGLVDSNNSLAFDFSEFRKNSQFLTASGDYSSPSSFSSSNSTSNVVDRLEDPHCHSSSTSRVPDLFTESQPVWQFNKGVEEAIKFLPNSNKLVIDLEYNGFFMPPEPKAESKLLVEVKAEEEGVHSFSNGPRARKNSSHEDLDLEEGRSIKQSAVSSTEETVRSDLFDRVLLCNAGDSRKDAISTLREALKNEVSKNTKNGTSKRSSGGKSRGKKQVKKEVVDLRTLLIHCAQSVAVDDRRSANELLKQIRQHSSSLGDGSQRLAQIFADGLEARLAGTGSQIYHSLMAKRTSATDILKAYHLYLAACPYKKISHFFANQTILNAAEKATTLHIIDFGIYFGYQWPCLIQRLASRTGGPPKLRITGIDVPQPGFRPTERIEETGRRLADYAQSFGVPFEYHPIASKWETIQIEDLKINKDEVLVVNCLYKFRNLVDETVVVDSPRNIVLNNIRKMNPDVFIHGIVNGAYSAPFFVTRFREALFHFSSLFDMLETTVPREHPERLLIEREIFGREAMNVIACEGSERVERPETYKQWQVRNLRAGFSQLPLNTDIMKKSRAKVKSCYNKDFVIDEDSRWLLQGWKGRVIYALSTWRPSHVRF